MEIVTSNLQRHIIPQPTTSNSHIALTHVYKLSFLRSYRLSPLSKHIDHKIYNYIRTLGILKPFRGRRSGRKVKIRNMTRNYIHVHGHNNKREISISSHHINSVPNTCNFLPIPAGETSTDSRLLKETPSKEFVPSLMLTNVMSLAPKIDEVSLFLLNKNPDVVFITETWLTNAIDKSHINIPEYNIVSCKNRSSGIHGGVCLYLRNSIIDEILDHFHNAETEVLWVKIRPTRLPRGFSCI